MKRRNFFSSLGFLLASESRGQSVPGNSETLRGHEIHRDGLLVARVAIHAPAGLTYTIYTVTNGAAFVALTLPLGQQVLWNGLTLLPGVQYDVAPNGIKLRELPLSPGDYVTVIGSTVLGVTTNEK